MSDIEKNVNKEIQSCDCENIKKELEKLKADFNQVKNERDHFEEAYKQLAEQNANIWGLYTTTIDYVVARTTTRKQGK